MNAEVYRYYSDTDTGRARAQVSIDNSDPDVIEPISTGPLSRRLLWKKEDLCPGSHMLTVMHTGSTGQLLTADFFR
jgi:hypothetical protein